MQLHLWTKRQSHCPTCIWHCDGPTVWRDTYTLNVGTEKMKLFNRDTGVTIRE